MTLLDHLAPVNGSEAFLEPKVLDEPQQPTHSSENPLLHNLKTNYYESLAQTYKKRYEGPTLPLARLVDLLSGVAPKATEAFPTNIKPLASKQVHFWSCANPRDDVCCICRLETHSLCSECDVPAQMLTQRAYACNVVFGCCGHAYHRHCISSWLEGGSDECPLCKARWSVASSDYTASQGVYFEGVEEGLEFHKKRDEDSRGLEVFGPRRAEEASEYLWPA